MIFIVDAYNVIHAMTRSGKLQGQNLRAGREALTDLCRSCRVWRKDIEKIILVFDSSKEVSLSGACGPSGIETVFTRNGETADDFIIRFLQDRKPRGSFTVVSGDNYVTNNARALAASVMGAVEFLSLSSALGKIKQAQKTAPAQDKKISPSIAGQITSEYKRYLGLG